MSGEAIRAVDGLVATGLERDPGHAAAISADGLVHFTLSTTEATTTTAAAAEAAALLPGRATGRAPLGLVGEPELVCNRNAGLLIEPNARSKVSGS